MPIVRHLKDQINREHRLAEESARSAILHAIRCGELLNDAKGSVPHSEWMPWLGENFNGSISTAHRYMRVAKNRELLESNSSSMTNLTVSEALRLLSDTSDDSEQDRLSDEEQADLERLEAQIATGLAVIRQCLSGLEDCLRERVVIMCGIDGHEVIVTSTKILIRRDKSPIAVIRMPATEDAFDAVLQEKGVHPRSLCWALDPGSKSGLAEIESAFEYFQTQRQGQEIDL